MVLFGTKYRVLLQERKEMKRETPYRKEGIRGVIFRVGNDFALARPVIDTPGIKPGETVSFSLSEWEGLSEPREQQVVELFNVTLFQRGWRAESARPIMPTVTRNGSRL